MDSLTEFINLRDLGVIGVLGVSVWLLLKGQIVPRSNVDEMKDHASTQTELLATKLADRILEGTEKAIEVGTQRGVSAALKEVNNKK